MWTSPYPLVRLGRGLVAVTAVRVAVGDYADAPIVLATSETLSVAYDLVNILPFFGNMLWMVLLLPTWTQIYCDCYLYLKRESHRREFRRLVVVYTAMMLYLAVSILEPLCGSDWK